MAAKNRLAVEFTLVVELAVTAVFTVVEESKDMVSMVKTPISSLFIFGGLTSYSQHLWEFGADEIHLYIHGFPLPLILYRAPSRMLVISKQYHRETVIQNSAVHPDSREG